MIGFAVCVGGCLGVALRAGAWLCVALRDAASLAWYCPQEEWENDKQVSWWSGW
jgi:hypothetical protein